MKKVITFLAGLFVFITANAQWGSRLYDTYSAYPYQAKNELRVYVSDFDSSEIILIVFATPPGANSKGIVVLGNIDTFVAGLNAAKSKYTEWVATAKNNKIDSLFKIMPIKVVGETLFYLDNDLHNGVAKFNYCFVISKQGGKVKYLLAIISTKITAADNRFISVPGFNIAFDSEAAIQSFIDKISIPKMRALLNSPKTEDLFK